MARHHARHMKRGLFTAVSALALALVASAPALASGHTNGDTSKPQPLSKADQNSGGANGQCPGGPYCSTRDGSPSGNGNQTTGQHKGEPCAGCVGKADNKNPKGQMPNGSDHNAGYECDRNHGIGRSNPAHTGCTTPTTSGGGGGGGSDCTTNPTAPGCPPVTPPTGGGGSDCTTNPTAPGCNVTPATGGGGGGGSACVPTAANNFCSSVLGEKQSKPPTAKQPNAEVLNESVTQPPAASTTSTLPMTGAAVVPLMAAGLGALAAGGLLLLVAARRRVS